MSLRLRIWLSLMIMRRILSKLHEKIGTLFCRLLGEMRKGLHPQMQWISYVTQSGRLMHVMMTKIHSVGKVYHLKAKRQMAENVGQIAKFRQRYEKAIPEKHES